MGSFDRWILGRRGAVIAALVALAGGLAGLLALPALDRNESAFVQATVQMLESGDFIAVRYQDYWRGGAAPGAHWLQALMVEAVSGPETRAIFAYRIVSLLSVALAAAATVWGAAPAIGGRPAFVAGVALSVSLMAAAAAGVATADAPFLFACTLLLAGFTRTYLAMRDKAPPRRRDRFILWAGLIAGVILKGPLILAIAGLAALFLAFADRQAPWLRSIGWGWGLIALVGLAGPWVVAVTVASDGAYWASADLPPRGPWLWQTWTFPLLAFPLSVLIPLAADHGWRRRSEPGVRVAAAWLLAAWIAAEAAPFKQVFGLLPLLPPLAWLGAAGLMSATDGGRVRKLSAGLAVMFAGALAGLAFLGARRFGLDADIVAGLAAAVLVVTAGLVAALAILRPAAPRFQMLAGALAILCWAWTLGVAAPALDRLWPTKRVIRALAASDLDPREGLAIGPVAAAGYQEPSLIFALGASTETGGGAVAARAIADGRPAIVEAAEEVAFREALTRLGASAEPIGLVEAYDYAGARDIRVTIYRSSSE